VSITAEPAKGDFRSPDRPARVSQCPRMCLGGDSRLATLSGVPDRPSVPRAEPHEVAALNGSAERGSRVALGSRDSCSACGPEDAKPNATHTEIRVSGVASEASVVVTAGRAVGRNGRSNPPMGTASGSVASHTSRDRGPTAAGPDRGPTGDRGKPLRGQRRIAREQSDVRTRTCASARGMTPDEIQQHWPSGRQFGPDPSGCRPLDCASVRH
jgi:hypothetical protein